MGRPGSLLASAGRLAVVLLLFGLVATALLPGGPLDVVDLQSQVEDAGGGGTVTADDATGTSTPPSAARGPSPWGEETLVVAVRNPAAPDRDVRTPVAAALDYWNANGGYGHYPATFRLDPDAEDPDVVVWYNASIACPAHGDAIGCAPVLDGDGPVDRPVRVQVRYDPADNSRQVRNTVIHELGHVLGITHCEEPRWVMASACAGEVPPSPDATERALAWRDDTLSVYVDESNVSAAELAETRDQVEHALGYVERETSANLTLVRAEDRFSADVAVVFEATSSCEGSAVVCYEHRGRDVDGDGRMEYYTAGTVLVAADSDVDARGWYVGWAMANQVTPGAVPPVFEDASYRERRSRWWETGRDG